MSKEQKVLDGLIADRRKFLKTAGLTGLGLAGAAMVGGKLGIGDGIAGMHSTPVEAASVSDADILNFALNLEYLEAEFYTMATTGKTLEQSGYNLGGKGTYGRTTGGQKITWGGALRSQLGRTANSLAQTEQLHVKFLRNALGSAAVAKPAINLDAVADVDTYQTFIVVARALEQTGESAYAGAAQFIQNKQYLTAAAQILAIEAEHTGNLRLFCDAYNLPTTKIDQRDVLPPPSGHYTEFTSYNWGLAPIRTTSEVLAIVYGKSTKGTSRGGFFPQGLNGAINVV